MAKKVEYKDYKNIKFEVKGGIARVTLNRPDIRNAFNDELIVEMCNLFQAIKDDDSIRVVVLTGSGTAFCAGADLNWMRKVVDYDLEENIMDAEHLVDMLEFIDTCPKPVIGRINGVTMGGGCGLVAVCDIAIAQSDAKFGFTEVKLGIVPAVISPYVLRKIGVGPARELFLTGERFDAQRALDIGLVNAVAAPDAIDGLIDQKIKLLKTSGPKAIDEGKQLIRKVPQAAIKEVRRITAETIAKLRISEEGREGITAFLEKREARWIYKDEEPKDKK